MSTEFNFAEVMTEINNCADKVLADRINPNNVTAATANTHKQALDAAKKKYNDAVTAKAYSLILAAEKPVKALIETLTYTGLVNVKFTESSFDIESVQAPLSLSGLDKAAKAAGVESPLNPAWRNTLTEAVKLFKLAAAADVEDKAAAEKHLKIEKVAKVPTKAELTDTLQKCIDIIMFKAKDNGDGNVYTVYKAHRALVEKLVLKQNKLSITGMTTDDMMYLVQLMLNVYVHNEEATEEKDKIKITIEWVEGALSDIKKK